MEEEKIIQIINGCLLGDGHLTKNNGIKQKSSFRYGSSSKEHVQFIKDSLQTNLFNLSEIKQKNIFDKRTNKTYTIYTMFSNTNDFLTEIRNKWYPEGIKIIPKDLILDDLTNLYWYIGDGSLSQNYKGQMTNHIKLSTNCFSIEDLKFLINQMKNFEAYINEKFHLVLIPRRKTEIFLNFIGNCPINDYKHKWKVFPYKYGEIKYLTSKDKQSIKQLHNQGVRHFEIANQLNLNKGSVEMFLKKSNIYKPKKIIWELINENGEIFETENLSQFARDNNLGQQNLRDLASKKRTKPYKGWLCNKEQIGGYIK